MLFDYVFSSFNFFLLQNDEFVWEKRPLPTDLVDAAAKVRIIFNV